MYCFLFLRIPVPQGSTPELTPQGYEFLTAVFEKYDEVSYCIKHQKFTLFTLY